MTGERHVHRHFRLSGEREGLNKIDDRIADEKKRRYDHRVSVHPLAGAKDEPSAEQPGRAA